MSRFFSSRPSGFTIIEILVIIVVIAIIATLSVIGYTTFTAETREASLRSNLEITATGLMRQLRETGDFPTLLADLNDGEGAPGTDAYDYEYTYNSKNFCLIGTSQTDADIVFSITQTGVVTEGECTLEAE